MTDLSNQNYESVIGKVQEVGSKPNLNTRVQKELKDLDLDHRKSEKGVRHKLLLWSIRIIWVIALAVLVVRLWHVVSPTNWRWLDTVQIASLDKLLFSGTIGTALGKYGGKILE